MRAPSFATALLLAVLIPSPARASSGWLAPPAEATLGQLIEHRHQFHAYMGAELFGFAAAAQSTEYPSGYLGSFGGGIGLFGGLRLSPIFSLEGNWTFSLHDQAWQEHHATGVQMDSIYLMSFSADIKVHLPTAHLVEPYLQGGAGVMLAGAIALHDRGQRSTASHLAKGLLVNAGAGLDIWIARHVSMGGRVLFRGIALGEPSFDVPLTVRARNFVSGVSVDALATLHF